MWSLLSRTSLGHRQTRGTARASSARCRAERLLVSAQVAENLEQLLQLAALEGLGTEAGIVEDLRGLNGNPRPRLAIDASVVRRSRSCRVHSTYPSFWTPSIMLVTLVEWTRRVPRLPTRNVPLRL